MKRVGGIPVMAFTVVSGIWVLEREGRISGKGPFSWSGPAKEEGVCVCLVHVEFGMNLGPGPPSWSQKLAH